MSDLAPGEWTADWDGLYWTFIDDHRAVFAANPRTRMVVSLLDKMDPGTLDSHRRRAVALLDADHDPPPLRTSGAESSGLA